MPASRLVDGDEPRGTNYQPSKQPFQIRELGVHAKTLVLVGGGGHCRSVIDVLERQPELFSIAGFVDLPHLSLSNVLGYPWLGADDDLPRLAREHGGFVVTAGQICKPNLRELLFHKVLAAGGNLPAIVSPSAILSPHASVGAGTILLHHSVVNSGARVGCNVIINTGAIVEHDVTVADHCHISTGAKVNGGVHISSKCFIGSGAVIKEGVFVGEGAVVGAGAVLLTNTEPFTTYAGVPAKPIEKGAKS